MTARKTNLRAMVARLLADGGLEPARWAQGRKVAGSAMLAEVGAPVANSLLAYAKAAEATAFRESVAAVVSRSGGFYWSVVPVRTPRRRLSALSRSSLVTLLSGCVPIAIDPDSGAFVIADWRTSAVASFLFDDVADSDPQPLDFVLEAMSLERFLTGYGDPDRRPRGNANGREIARLYRRGIWIAYLICESDCDPDDLPELSRIASTARDASPIRAYGRERARFTSHPHDAMYWLLAFALLGAGDQLADALARTAAVKHPAVRTLRTYLAAGGDLLGDRNQRWPERELATVLGEIARSISVRADDATC